MYLLKCRAYFWIIFISLWPLSKASAYTLNECLDVNFKTTVTHPSWPFGLTSKNLTIEKNDCILEISHNRLKFMNRKWSIDVCREPVHIKYGLGDVSVFKRDGACNPAFEGEFCQHTMGLRQIIQDDGLIFAKGKREELKSDHGRVYCAYLLLNSYLVDGKVLGSVPANELQMLPSAETKIIDQQPAVPGNSQGSESSKLHNF